MNNEMNAGVLAVRAQEILCDKRNDRENLAIRIARLEQRDAAVAELIEANAAVDSMFDNDGPLLIAYAAEITRLRAATARIGGQS